MVNADPPILSINTVTKNFGGLCAVNRVSFNVRPKEVLGIIGPNGSGKTTLLNLITVIFPPTSGEIYFKGHKLNGLRPYQVNSLGIARNFQDDKIFLNMSAIENAMVGSHGRSRVGLYGVGLHLNSYKKEEQEIFERAWNQLAFLGLEKKGDTSPSALSVKERHLLGIARALVTEPELLLLDEPVAGLSFKETEEMGDLILLLRERGMTVLLIEHRLQMIMNISDRLIVLNFGCKIAEGAPAEIRENEEVIAAYLGKG